MAVVTETDTPKSFRNRCVIEVFDGHCVFVFSRMPTRDAYSSGRLIPSFLGLAYVLLVETNPFFRTCYFSGLCSSKIPRYFLDFAYWRYLAKKPNGGTGGGNSCRLFVKCGNKYSSPPDISPLYNALLAYHHNILKRFLLIWLSLKNAKLTYCHPPSATDLSVQKGHIPLITFLNKVIIQVCTGDTGQCKLMITK